MPSKPRQSSEIAPVTTIGHLVHRGNTLGFAEAEIRDLDSNLATTATGTLRIATRREDTG